jgi:hypothetical protein
LSKLPLKPLPPLRGLEPPGKIVTPRDAANGDA